MISKQIFLKFFISYFIILECGQVYESIRKPKKSNPINIKDLVDQNVNVICHFDQIVISHPSQTKPKMKSMKILSTILMMAIVLIGSIQSKQNDWEPIIRPSSSLLVRF